MSDLEKARKAYEEWGYIAMDQDPAACTDYIEALEAELQKARDALEPFARIAHVVLSEAPANVDYYSVFLDCQGVSHRLKMDELRAIRALSQDKEG